MSADWKLLTRESGFKVSADGAIRVPCGNERSQTVFVEPHEEAIRLCSNVVPRRHAPPQPELTTWKMNRYRELVSFKVVERGRIIGEVWLPDIGITVDEWRIAIRTLAMACDRLEYLWTGRDVE